MVVGVAALASCSKRDMPKTFEDCILEKTPSAKTSEAVAVVQAACKGKFPKVFDFDAIASSASVSNWREVARKEAYTKLPQGVQSKAQKEYFETVVIPRVDPVFIEDARAQFDAYTLQAERAASASASAASAAPKP